MYCKSSKIEMTYEGLETDRYKCSNCNKEYLVSDIRRIVGFTKKEVEKMDKEESLKKKKIKKEAPKCDYGEECRNKAYAEIYPSLMGGKHKGRCWSYLCRKHYYQEQKRYKNKLPVYILK